MSNNNSASNNSASVNTTKVNDMFLTATSVKQFAVNSTVVVGKNQYAALRSDKALKGFKVVCADNLSTTVLTRTQLSAIKARRSVESLVVTTGTKTIAVGGKKFMFDFDNLRVVSSVKWNPETNKYELDWQQVRPTSVLQFAINSKVVIEEYVDSRAIMVILMNNLKGCKAIWQAEQAFAPVKGGLFIDNNAYGKVSVVNTIVGGNINMQTPQYHWEQNKVNVFAVNETLSFCKGKVTKNTFSLVNNSVNPGVAVISDKQASKFFVIGAGAEAMGVYKVGDELVSFNPLGNTNKGANRIAAGNSKGGQFVGATYSNLFHVLSNGSKTATHGRMMHTMVALGLSCVAQGEMISNAQDFTFSVTKAISVEVNINTLGIKQGATKEEVFAAIGEISEGLKESKELENRTLVKGDSISINDVVLYSHKKEVAVTLTGKFNVRVGNYGFAGKPSTIVFKFFGVAHMNNKKNIKARGESVKATSVAATRETFQVTSNGVADSNWEVVLHSESFKTVQKLLAMYANDAIGQNVEYVNGVLTVDGVELSQEKFNAWILSKLETRVIRRLVCNEDLADMQGPLLNTKVQSVEINGESIELSGAVTLVPANSASLGDAATEGFTWVEQEVKVIVGFSHFRVEVCTADEWYGTSKAGVIEQYVFGTFHAKLANSFANKANRAAKDLKFVETSGESNTVLSNEGLRTFNLDNAGEVKLFISKIKSATQAMNENNSGIKGMLESLYSDIKQDGFHAIRLSFSINKHVWSADIPVKGMLRFANFDSKGNPSNDFCDVVGAPGEEGTNKIDEAVSVVQNFVGLLATLKTFGTDKNGVKDAFVHYQFHVRNWIANVQTKKIVSRLVKGQDMTHLKVVPSFTLGWTKHEYQDGTTASIPNLGFASDSPIWETVNIGDIVIGTRMPFPTCVAFRAVVDASIDRTMVSVSPVLMSKGNRGDFDGDSLYVMSPRVVSGVTGIRLAEEFNNSLWSLEGFSRSLKAGASNPVIKTIVDTFKGEDLVAKFFTIGSSKSSQQWGKDLEKVNEVYTEFVGLTYGWAFDATVKLFESGNSVTESAVLSVLNRWISYEEDTLGGYSEAGYAAVVAFKTKLKGINDTTIKCPQMESVAAPSVSTAWANHLAVRGVTLITDNDDFALRCAAGLTAAKAVQRGEANPAIVEPLALTALAIRQLTAKSQFVTETNFFAVAHEYGVSNSRSAVIAILAESTPIKWSK